MASTLLHKHKKIWLAMLCNSKVFTNHPRPSVYHRLLFATCLIGLKRVLLAKSWTLCVRIVLKCRSWEMNRTST